MNRQCPIVAFPFSFTRDSTRGVGNFGHKLWFYVQNNSQPAPQFSLHTVPQFWTTFTQIIGVAHLRLHHHRSHSGHKCSGEHAVGGYATVINNYGQLPTTILSFSTSSFPLLLDPATICFSCTSCALTLLPKQINSTLLLLSIWLCAAWLGIQKMNDGSFKRTNVSKETHRPGDVMTKGDRD